jgi:hypothetical protein
LTTYTLTTNVENVCNSWVAAISMARATIPNNILYANAGQQRAQWVDWAADTVSYQFISSAARSRSICSLSTLPRTPINAGSDTLIEH